MDQEEQDDFRKLPRAKAERDRLLGEHYSKIMREPIVLTPEAEEKVAELIERSKTIRVPERHYNELVAENVRLRDALNDIALASRDEGLAAMVTRMRNRALAALDPTEEP